MCREYKLTCEFEFFLSCTYDVDFQFKFPSNPTISKNTSIYAKKTLKNLIESPFDDTPKCDIDFSFIFTPSFKRWIPWPSCYKWMIQHKPKTMDCICNVKII